MTLKNVTYVRMKDLTKEQKEELGLDVAIKNGIVAIESHNPEYKKKAKILKKGMVNYILNGD